MVMDMIDEKNASVRHLSANLPVDEEIVVPFRRNSRKIMPNDPCPCGSGRKYKHCCGKNR
jgi:preprotein translocase subunit SecA